MVQGDIRGIQKKSFQLCVLSDQSMNYTRKEGVSKVANLEPSENLMGLFNFSLMYVLFIFIEKIRNQCSDLSFALVGSIKSGYSTFFQEPLDGRYAYSERLQGQEPFSDETPECSAKIQSTSSRWPKNGRGKYLPLVCSREIS